MRITLGDISFEQWLWFLVGCIVLWIFLWQYLFSKKTAIVFSFTELLPTATIGWTMLFRGKRLIVALLIISIFALLAQPQRVNQQETVTKEWIDIVLALDISYSMEADDFQPNRLTVAKNVLSGFIDALESDRVWMVVFAGIPFTSVPLTFDYRIFQDILWRTTTATIQQEVPWLQWTAIGDAILSSLQVLEKGREELKEDESREQVLVLVTDGTANVGVDPRAAASLAQEQNVRIYTIGVGSEQWGFITQQTPFGTRRQQIEGVDETTLRALAEITNGQYRRATDERTFQAIAEELKTLQRHDLEIEQQRLYVPYTRPFVVLLLLCIVGLYIQERYFVITE